MSRGLAVSLVYLLVFRGGSHHKQIKFCRKMLSQNKPDSERPKGTLVVFVMNINKNVYKWNLNFNLKKNTAPLGCLPRCTYSSKGTWKRCDLKYGLQRTKVPFRWGFIEKTNFTTALENVQDVQERSFVPSSPCDVGVRIVITADEKMKTQSFRLQNKFLV